MASTERMRGHGRRGRHLLRVIRRSSHSSIQDMAVRELQHHIDNRHGFRRLGRARGSQAAPAATGHWRPLTRKARQLIAQLRKTRVWKLQKQLVRELARELQYGRRLIDRARERLAPAGRAVSRATALAGRSAGRWIGRQAARIRERSRTRPDPVPEQERVPAPVPRFQVDNGGIPRYPSRTRTRRQPARRQRTPRPAARTPLTATRKRT